MDLQIFYATNRAHEGPQQFQPTSYGALFSNDGMENLRFGRVSFSADDAKVASYLNRTRAPVGQGDGEGLQDYLATVRDRLAAHRGLSGVDPEHGRR